MTTTDPNFGQGNVVPLKSELGQNVSGPLSPAGQGYGGGGGGMSALESRVASLEAYTETIRADVGAMKLDMRDIRDRTAKLEVKVDHLPSKGYVVVALMALLAGIAALIAYQEQIQLFLGL